MLYTSKTKSDVNLKGQRIQRFLQENINRAKTRQLQNTCTAILRNLIPGSAHPLSRDNELVERKKKKQQQNNQLQKTNNQTNSKNLDALT